MTPLERFLTTAEVFIKGITIKFQRSDLPGYEPPNSEPHSIAINVSDKRFWLMDEDGLPHEYKLIPVTPANRWSGAGVSDPHRPHYSAEVERGALCRGDLTDDELANMVYLKPDIVNLTAAKERIRWLSRSLIAATEQIEQLRFALRHEQTRHPDGGE